MNWIHVIILALVQGMAELLPVSSSAHVIVAASLLGDNMSSPANALLLVLLHTGTMFAVIAYFWRRWVEEFFASWERFWRFVQLIFVASAVSGMVGYPIILGLGKVLHISVIEDLFARLDWIAAALAGVGVLIIVAGRREARGEEAAQPSQEPSVSASGRGEMAAAAPAEAQLSWPMIVWMGVTQGIAIPFRGYSRSGGTISAGLLLGGARHRIESFSFAMAVAITPLAIAREVYRVVKHAHAVGLAVPVAAVATSGALGMVCAFVAGLLALKWLSSWLEHGRWHWFGYYCLAFSVVVAALYFRGL